MSQENELTPAERELEAALMSLAPMATRLDPMAAAFAAGRISARREVRMWRAAAAALAVLAAGTWVLPSVRNEVAVMRVGIPAKIASSPAMPPLPEQSMAVLRKTIWEKGVDGLTPVQLAPAKSIHIDEINLTHRGES
ncbi:MAG TPA: hypothetical protein VHU84_19915 [Lacipirellulaceae bacterium]|nr:hypothetical protein [Lacipirellulaceae bacterium]